MNVGWIGLGEIGKEMVLRSLAAGHRVVAYDRGAGKQEAEVAGATLVGDYRAVAGDCELLCVCVFSDAQVREVMFDGGALAAMKPGSILAIHTTGSPVLARDLVEQAPADVAVIDACFSGGSHDTARGDVTLMVGGDEAALEKARPVFSTYASRINWLGPIGAGQTLKLLNNLLFAANLKQAAAIVEIATSQGLDPMLAAQVISQSSGASMAMGLLQNAPPELILENVRPYMAKDVRAAIDAARESGIDIEMFVPTLDHFS